MKSAPITQKTGNGEVKMSPKDLYKEGDLVQFIKPRMWNESSHQEGCIGMVTGFNESDSGRYIQHIIIDNRWYVLPSEVKGKV